MFSMKRSDNSSVLHCESNERNLFVDNLNKFFVLKDGLFVHDLELVPFKDETDLILGVCLLVCESELLLHDLVREVK